MAQKYCFHLRRPGTACAGGWHQQESLLLDTVDASGKVKGLMIWRHALKRYWGMWGKTQLVQNTATLLEKCLEVILSCGIQEMWIQVLAWLQTSHVTSGQIFKRDLAFTKQSSSFSSIRLLLFNDNKKNGKCSPLFNTSHCLTFCLPAPNHCPFIDKPVQNHLYWGVARSTSCAWWASCADDPRLEKVFRLALKVPY